MGLIGAIIFILGLCAVHSLKTQGEKPDGDSK